MNQKGPGPPRLGPPPPGILKHPRPAQPPAHTLGAPVPLPQVGQPVVLACCPVVAPAPLCRAMSPSRCPEHGGCGMHHSHPGTPGSLPGTPLLVAHPALMYSRHEQQRLHQNRPAGVQQQGRTLPPRGTYMVHSTPGYRHPSGLPPIGLPPAGRAPLSPRVARVAPPLVASEKKSAFVILADGSLLETPIRSVSPFRGKGFRPDSRSRSRSPGSSRSRSISPGTRSSSSSFANFRRTPAAGRSPGSSPTRGYPLRGSSRSVYSRDVSPIRLPYGGSLPRGAVSQITRNFENVSPMRMRRPPPLSNRYRSSSSRSREGSPERRIYRDYSPVRRPYVLRDHSPPRRPYPKVVSRDVSPSWRSYGRNASPTRKSPSRSSSRCASRDVSPRRTSHSRDPSPNRRSVGRQSRESSPGSRLPHRHDASPSRRPRPSGHSRDCSPQRRGPSKEASPARNIPRNASPNQRIHSRSREASPGNRAGSRSRDISPKRYRYGTSSREHSPEKVRSRVASREASPRRNLRSREPSPARLSNRSSPSRRVASREPSPARRGRASQESSPSRRAVRSREPSPGRMVYSRSREPSPSRHRDTPSRFIGIEKSRSRESSPGRRKEYVSPSREGSPTRILDNELDLTKSASVPHLDSISTELGISKSRGMATSTPSMIPVPISRLSSPSKRIPGTSSFTITDSPQREVPLKSPQRTPQKIAKSREAQTPKKSPDVSRRLDGSSPRKSPAKTAQQTPVRGARNTSTAARSPSKIPRGEQSPKKKSELLTPSWTEPTTRARNRRNSVMALAALTPNTARRTTSKPPLPQRTAQSSPAKTPKANNNSNKARPSSRKATTMTKIKAKMNMEKAGSAGATARSASSKSKSNTSMQTISNMKTAAGARRLQNSNSTGSLVSNKAPEPAPVPMRTLPEVPTPAPRPNPSHRDENMPYSPGPPPEIPPGTPVTIIKSSKASKPDSPPPTLREMDSEVLSVITAAPAVTDNGAPASTAPILASLVGGGNEPSSTLVASTTAAPLELAKPDVATVDPLSTKSSEDSIKIPDGVRTGQVAGTPAAVRRAGQPNSTASNASTAEVDSKGGQSLNSIMSDVSGSSVVTVVATGTREQGNAAPATMAAGRSVPNKDAAKGADAVSTSRSLVRGDPEVQTMSANAAPNRTGPSTAPAPVPAPAAAPSVPAAASNQTTPSGGPAKRRLGLGGCLRWLRRPRAQGKVQRPPKAPPRSMRTPGPGFLRRLACCGRRTAPKASAEALTAPANTSAPAAQSKKSGCAACCGKIRAFCCTARRKDAAAAAAVAATRRAAPPQGSTESRAGRCSAMLRSCCGALFCLNTACCLGCGCRQPGRCCARCCPLPEETASSTRRTSQQRTLSRGKSTTASSTTELGKLDAALVEYNGMMRGAIPVLPLPLAWVCLVFNVFVPGLGTLSMGLFCLCVGKPRFSSSDTVKARLGAFCVDTVVAATQLFTVLFCLVGWGWSIWWGFIALRLARKYRRIQLAERAAATRPAAITMPPAARGGRGADVERGGGAGAAPRPP